MIKAPGRKPTIMEKYSFMVFVKKRCFCDSERVIIHHITEDTPERLQMEVEIRCQYHPIRFERIVA